jgi:2-polyprenyl-3-methyl-5-hydroxy-6-metoxy-1,4-benzoquinol methylase
MPVDVMTCPACGCNRIESAFSSNDLNFGTAGQFHYARCLGCVSVFQTPRVAEEDLSAHYPTEYYTHTRPAPEADTAQARIRSLILDRYARGTSDAQFLLATRAIRELLLWRLPGELVPSPAEIGMGALEIGCGNGDLLRKLQKLGWDATGVEWDETAANISRTTGLTILSGDFRTIHFTRRYRLIVLNHVFEHVDSPTSVLNKLLPILEPGGRIVLVVPNPESLAGRALGNLWMHWDAPRHLVLVSARGFNSLALANGLTPRVRTRTGRGRFPFTAGAKRRTRSLLERTIAVAEWGLASTGLLVGQELVCTLETRHVQ